MVFVLMRQHLAILLCLSMMAAGDLRAQSPTALPNIVWITVEDMSAHFSCYGETTIQTPHVDRLAREGIRFTHAFTTGPICSISRSAVITGCYQTSIGCQNHRSGTERFPIPLPAGVRMIPEVLKDAGYHVSNVSLDDFLKASGAVGVAKTDYNFQWAKSQLYETSHWTHRREGQPFFVQVQLNGGKYRGQAPRGQWPQKVQETLGSTTDPSQVILPAYLPDHPVIRADWAQYLDCVRYTDWEVGQILKRLDDAQVRENTIVFFWTDHGISHVRNKQFLYDGGVHIPLIVNGPSVPAGQVRDELVEHIDVAAATVALAKATRPAGMQARNLLDDKEPPRTFVFAARDRADETVDRIRSARSKHYKYIRNYFPNRPYLQPNRYKDEKAIVQTLRQLHASSQLDAHQKLILAESRPREELYDLDRDPLELENLAEDPALATTLAEHRAALDQWIVHSNDQGKTLEPREVYLSYTMDERPEGARGKKSETFQQNVDLMLRWSDERPMQP